MNSKDAINKKIYYLEARNTLDTNVVTIKYWLGSIDIFEDCLKSDFPNIIGLSFLKGFLVSLINARIMKDLEANEMEEEIRIHYWEYNWDDIKASGSNYNLKVLYQVSVIAEIPRHPKLLELKKKLNKKGIFPSIQHEYFPEKRRVHSFFSIEVLENV